MGIVRGVLRKEIRRNQTMNKILLAEAMEKRGPKNRAKIKKNKHKQKKQ